MAKASRLKTRTQPLIVMESEVARKIRQHACSSMKAEVCGVLIGSADDDRTHVEACIAGINAAQGGAHVTFTQDTWEHIYKIKDQQYPDDRIVGWYHSHPGFGVFLSEHDLFIQENFFSSPQQVAWVYDPHTGEEGCFGWVNGKIEKLSEIRFGYSQSVEAGAARGRDAGADDDSQPMPVHQSNERRRSSEPVWVRWGITLFSYLAVMVLGFLLGYQYFVHRLRQFVDEQEHLYQQMLIPPGSPAGEPPAPGPSSSPAQKNPPQSGRGSDGKYGR
ncbi:MAG TPA: Mov34/MPN/PAD-1 family protein [Candidatus Limnocylindrales bacterium]|nr:Mov34/MPN/PAD-1 family protein [Candidatus Limnocylindrales bacterium]